MSGHLYFSYTVGVVTPETIDSETLADIEAAADTQDSTLEYRVQRWLGSAISDAESRLADGLPEGWRVSVIQND